MDFPEASKSRFAVWKLYGAAEREVLINVVCLQFLSI